MKQTAVEWLFEKLWNTDKDKLTWYAILEQAKEIEKEQIAKALIRGHNDCGVFTMQSECDEYYNETYKSK